MFLRYIVQLYIQHTHQMHLIYSENNNVLSVKTIPFYHKRNDMKTAIKRRAIHEYVSLKCHTPHFLHEFYLNIFQDFASHTLFTW